MAGIFNLFGNSPVPDKGQLVQPLSRPKSSFGLNVPSAKALDQPKPKGLSIRPNSDSNIPASPRPNSLGQDTPKKQQQYLKPKLTQLGTDNRPLSPRKEFAAKKLNEHPSKIKEVSPIKDISNKKNIKRQRAFDEDVFKKPLPPKRFVKKSYPEPEQLAPYCDMQLDLDCSYATIDAEFKQLFMEKRKEMENEDEGFLSDPEPLEIPDLPQLHLSWDLYEDC